jgi:hypothetical protein
MDDEPNVPEAAPTGAAARTLTLAQLSATEKSRATMDAIAAAVVPAASQRLNEMAALLSAHALGIDATKHRLFADFAKVAEQLPSPTTPKSRIPPNPAHETNRRLTELASLFTTAAAAPAEREEVVTARERAAATRDRWILRLTALITLLTTVAAVIAVTRH